jgi:anti-sigma regulatory factor (Ser/Thr protein kinase)
MALVELEIPSRSAYVAVVRLAVASLGRHAELDEEAVDDLKIAVSEACANSVLSNEEAGSKAPISVSWSEAADRLVVEVSDRGPRYEPNAPSQAERGEFASRFEMSVALLRSLVEGCEFEAREGGGMRTRLIVSR